MDLLESLGFSVGQIRRSDMYQWDPENYKDCSSPQKSWAEAFIAEIPLQGNERILDIGCGDGKITAGLAKLLPHGSILGLDSSSEMICYACAHWQLRNLEFRLGDASALDFLEEFDLVVSFACLHWVLDHEPVLKGISRALKPGGRAYLQFAGRGNAAAVLQAAHQTMEEERWRGYFPDFDFPYGFFDVSEYRPWIEQSGLRILRLELVCRQMVQPSRQGMAGWMATTWMPYTDRLPQELRSAFMDEVIARYTEGHPPARDGSISVSMVRLEAVLEKPISGGDHL
ncbi:MAG TPA: methyltransferase domain-containing protein [Methanotrichaceae archaeon]|nr:methyltransferase domain-containing protein [Methanotrichaceae archaeon]HQJ28446.1 methyltransferase domain-containing protein [Methanotrichaceae archaeon]